MDQTTLSLLIIGGIILLVIVLLTIGFLVKRTVTATVAGFSWKRTISLEHLVWVQENNTSSFPQGSMNQQKRRESYQSYEFQRTDTTTSTVNGQTTTTSTPVYAYVTRWRTRYTYNIQRWQ